MTDSTIKEAISVLDLKTELQRDGEQTFRKKYDHPFLLVRNDPPDDSDWIDLKTIETSAKSLQKEIDSSTPVQAVALRKSARNTYQSKITVGRARNNDIIIRAPKISKVHGAVNLVKAGRAFELCDMGSSNGTWLNANRLEKDDSQRIQSGDRITFWRYEFEFLDLDSFITFLGSPQA